MEDDAFDVAPVGPLLVNNELKVTSWVNNHYIKAATSENTRKAYRSDIQHYERWGGCLPATPSAMTRYLQAFADSLNTRTLVRRLTALRHWHVYQGFPDPSQHPAVQKTLAGIIRVHGKPKQKASPLLTTDLLMIAKYLHHEGSLSACRDNAMLQIGFFGAMRRSELVNLWYEHIEWKEQGIDLLIPHSKTDQTHEGQHIAIVYGKSLLCPITALKAWLDKSNIKQGPVFRKIKKNGHINEKALTPLMINHILKKRAEESGVHYADQLSSHSLRRGLATCASQVGANLAEIMRQGRWKQVNTVMEYVEASERFAENVSNKILQDVKFEKEDSV